MAELVITLADGRTHTHMLGETPEVIGRDAHCDIPLDDPSASRRHARFSRTPEGYVVEDMGSKNGTLVNDQVRKSTLLRSGDQVQVGSTVVVFTQPKMSTAGSVVIADEPTASHATRYIGREQRLLLSQKRLEMIYELSARLTTLQSRELLLENAMDICFETLQFERGAVGVKRRDSRVLDWPVVRNLRGMEGELTISRTLLTRALQHGERAIFTDDSRTSDPTVSMVQHGIRSAMCVPLLHNEQTIGVIYGDRTTSSTSYSHEDIDFLAGIAQQVSVGLINCRLLEDQEQMVRLQQDLDVARRIQTGLFPAELPEGSALTVAAVNDPGQRVSGDYYDVIECDDGRVWCLIADVTGEGIPAALLMANLQAAVRVTIKQSDDPAALLSQWNELICRNTDPGTFITCLLALIDPVKRSVRLASAGHHLPIVTRASIDTAEELQGDPGFPLGLVPEEVYATGEIELGDEPFTMFCYTDGVIEAMNAEQQLYGKSRLLETLASNRELAPPALVKRIRKDLATFALGARQNDDITALAARLG